MKEDRYGGKLPLNVHNLARLVAFFLFFFKKNKLRIEYSRFYLANKDVFRSLG